MSDREPGTAKCFKDSRGYGFIKRDGGGDVFVYFPVIQTDGHRTLRRGQRRSEWAMAAGTVSLRYFILGLLTQQPMSGYDIKRFLKGLSWLIGNPSGGGLDPVLRSLRQGDLATVEVVPGLDRPPRKIYSITEAEHQALLAWIEQPIVANAALGAFVMRLLLADSHSFARLSAHLQQRRAQVATHHAELVGGLETPGARLNLGRQLALDHGLALATAQLAWLDTTLDRLPEQWMLWRSSSGPNGAAIRRMNRIQACFGKAESAQPRFRPGTIRGRGASVHVRRTRSTTQRGGNLTISSSAEGEACKR
jgi:CspA family cold shock protein